MSPPRFDLLWQPDLLWSGVASSNLERPLTLARLPIPLALAAVVVAGLSLSACGRNGPPELPPGPAIQAVPSAANTPSNPPSPVAASAATVPVAAGPAPNAAATPQSVAAKTGFDAEGNPAAPPGQPKPFLLDPLLR
jgi:predicted small lipoprotein YifL